MIQNGVLRAFNATAYTAEVQLSGSLPTYLTGIAVARNILSADMQAGRRCAVAFFADATDPQNAVLFAVFT